MASIPFRPTILAILKRKAKDSGCKLGDFCEAMIYRGLQHMHEGSMPMYTILWGSALSPTVVPVSAILHVKLKKCAEEAHIHLTDLCNSIAVMELGIAEQELPAHHLQPMHRKLSFHLPHDSQSKGRSV